MMLLSTRFRESQQGIISFQDDPGHLIYYRAGHPAATCYFAAIELTSHGQMESRCVYFVVGVFIKNVLYPGQQYASRLQIQRLVSTTGSIGFSASALFFFCLSKTKRMHRPVRSTICCSSVYRGSNAFVLKV
jgi:hypothetical protein